VDTDILLTGECVIYKNDVLLDKAFCDFSYDHDLRLFKLITDGDIWTTFQPSQVHGVGAEEVGSFIKKWEVSIDTKWPDGDEFTYVFKQPNKELAESAKAKVEGIVENSRGHDEVIRLLKTRERVASADVAALLSKFHLDATDKVVQRVVESAITSGQVEGVFDGKEFISKYGLQRETVRYDIVTKFEMSSSGAIVITCPKCGAALPLEGKESSGKCQYCGTPYTVPRKILDLV